MNNKLKIYSNVVHIVHRLLTDWQSIICKYLAIKTGIPVQVYILLSFVIL